MAALTVRPTDVDFEISVGLFPGQGSYRKNSLREAWLRADDVVTETFAILDEAASRMLGKTVTDHIFRPDPPSADELISSAPDVLQLAVFGTSAAAFRILDAQGAAPSILLGHSLGEITALVCGGAYSLRDGAAILCHRISILSRLDTSRGLMLSIGCGATETAQILALVGDPQLVVAVENSPRQTVVSGPSAGIRKVQKVAEGIGLGTRVLCSPHPFHNPLLDAAKEEIVQAVRKYPRRPFTRPVFSPVLGRFYRDGDDLAELIGQHLVLPVHFGQAIARFHRYGARIFVELGPGTALTDLVRQAHRDATVLTPLARPERDGFASVAAFLTYGPAPVALPGLLDVTSPAQPLPSTVDLVVSTVPLPSALPAGSPADRMREAAAATAPALAPEPSSRDALFAEVRAIYAEALEYPEEVFEENVQLEAELGVDSLKQTALLQRLQERYGIEPPETGFRLPEYDTFGKIVDLVATATLARA